MRLVEFVMLYKRNKGCFNSFLTIRSNPQENIPSYYFRNIKSLNSLFKTIFQSSNMSLSSFESFFLQKLPKCLSQVNVNFNTSENEASNLIKDYFQKLT
jgi:hypothetical protein